ncbi:MAG TPA: metallophosphoesterase family protein [Geminicoccaceae bacterium]|nr:metallophosphoesterase family protein [Geminicoccaceae bacterium]
MAVFFTADTHFGHGGALGLFRRPFPSVRAMDEAMIARWNETVGPADEVWHLGDFAVRRPAAEMARLLAALHGKVHLVAGNNDGPETMALSGFASVHYYLELELEGVRLVLCHYPFRSWNGMARGAIDLHGHSHGRLSRLPRQLDVGVDVWDFRPITLEAVLGTCRRRTRRVAHAARS